MLLSKSQLLCICIYHNTLIIHYALYKNSNYNIIEKKVFVVIRTCLQKNIAQ